MKKFVQLFKKLDETTGTLEKISALRAYFRIADPGDASWALFFLMGGKMRRVVSTTLLKEWAMEMANIPVWLFEESYSQVGDLAETISLLIPLSTHLTTEEFSLRQWVEGRLASLRALEASEQKEIILSWLRSLDPQTAFLVIKMMTGSFRVGVSRGLIERAISEIAGLPRPQISHRLMGDWKPTPDSFLSLIHPEFIPGENDSKLYPFFLASPLETASLDEMQEKLGDAKGWVSEWKWDGIRAQLIRRKGATYLWSRGEELITDRFPEVTSIGERLPDGTVLDGEILAYENNAPRPFSDLQKRIGRLKVTQTFMNAYPVDFMAYDLLEENGQDLRLEPFVKRRTQLEALSERAFFKISPLVLTETWQELELLREESRERKVEGFILKKKDSLYQSGRKRGDWWKWKVSPFTIDAVLLYAQPGHGRRSGLYTDYTFALWSNELLVPIAKAYSGLSDQEIAELDRWIKSHTLQKFGPVRSVEAHHVFELAFEGVALSTRHKSGVAVRFPRILRWRKDKRLEDANQLQELKDLVHLS